MHKTLREKREETIENRKNKDKSQKQKQQFSAIDTVELTDSDIAEYRPKRRLRIISPRNSSPSNTFSPQNRRELLEEECKEVQGFISDEGDGLETFKDENEKSTSVELSEWDEKDNPTSRLKVKLQLRKRKEALWKLALEVPAKKRKIDQEGADESGFEGDCSEAEEEEEEVEEEEFMEEEVDNKENFWRRGRGCRRE